MSFSNWLMKIMWRFKHLKFIKRRHTPPYTTDHNPLPLLPQFAAPLTSCQSKPPKGRKTLFWFTNNWWEGGGRGTGVGWQSERRRVSFYTFLIVPNHLAGHNGFIYIWKISSWNNALLRLKNNVVLARPPLKRRPWTERVYIKSGSVWSSTCGD